MSIKRNYAKRPRLSSEGSGSTSLSSLTSSSSSDEEKDPKDLKPIKDYLHDRKEMAAQLFKSVKSEKIRMMLPQILKKVDFSELEELCAAELIGMSKSRILCILDGKEMIESSATDDSDDSGPSLEIISDTEWLSDEDLNIKVEGSKKNKSSKKSKKKKQENKTKLKSKEKVSLKKSNVKVKLEKVKAEQTEKDKEKNSAGKEKGKEKNLGGKEKEKNVSAKENEKNVSEKEKQKVKEKNLPKEGTGSLLDLLELEMRARAIRALIRKEEDSSSLNSKTAAKDTSIAASKPGTSDDNSSKIRQASLKEQLEKIDVLIKHGEEDDVYVVINPAPTIDLLSSDSDNESSSKRTNKKLVSERVTEKENLPEKRVEAPKEKDLDKIKSSCLEKGNNQNPSNKEEEKLGTKQKDIKYDNENFNLPITAVEIFENEKVSNLKDKMPLQELEDGEIIDEENEKMDKETSEPIPSTSQEIMKKIKKNPHFRLKKRNRERSDDEKSCQPKNKEIIIGNKKIGSTKEKNENTIKELELNDPIEIEDSPERHDISNKESSSKEQEFIKVNSTAEIFDDDKSLDIEEIINLDDYPDEMDDLDNTESIKGFSDNKEKLSSEINSDKDKNSLDKTHPNSETWASRYYQKDEVQNVIKESKIQSEIRKRLRERQRQSKLNNSPKIEEQEISEEPVVPKPTGSVEEYLALKGLKKANNDSSESKNNELVNEKEFDLQKSELNALTEENKSITIVKKPQLNVKILSIEKIDPVEQILAVERLNEIVKTSEMIFRNSDSIGCCGVDETEKKNIETEPLNITKEMENTIITANDSKSTEVVKTTEIIVEDESMSVEDVIVAGSIISPNNVVIDNLLNVNEPIQSSEDKNISFSKEDEFTSRSDSSDDNIIVKIGDLTSNDERTEISNQGES